MSICDHFGYGINLDGTIDYSFSTTVRGVLADSTSGEAGTFSGWRNTNYPVKVVLDSDGNIIAINGNNVMFSPTVQTTNCESTTKYDCVNGKCELQTKYNTPGFYQSLQDCESVCGNGVCVEGKQCLDPVNYCPLGKVCIEDTEHTKIQSLIKQIKSNFC